MRKSVWLTLLLILFQQVIFAQEVDMADGLRAEGKIYVVILVLAIIVTGLFGYLFYLDKKVSSKEKNITEQ